MKDAVILSVRRKYTSMAFRYGGIFALPNSLVIIFVEQDEAFHIPVKLAGE